MKIPKKRWVDIVWVALFLIIMFTSLGKTIKVFINSVIALSPNVIEQPEAKVIDNMYWSLESLATGEVINLENYKGKVIFINTWATWCPPCLAEMPDINTLYADYKDKVVFLMVTSDHKSAVNQLMHKENYDFINYTMRSSVPNVLSSRSIPYTSVIDKKGRIRVEKTGAAKWNSTDFRLALDSMLNE